MAYEECEGCKWKGFPFGTEIENKIPCPYCYDGNKHEPGPVPKSPLQIENEQLKARIQQLTESKPLTVGWIRSILHNMKPSEIDITADCIHAAQLLDQSARIKNLCEGCELWPCGIHSPIGIAGSITQTCANRKPTAGASIAELEILVQKLTEQKTKVYGWLDEANLKKNAYLARAEKAEHQRDELVKAIGEAVELHNGLCRFVSGLAPVSDAVMKKFLVVSNRWIAIIQPVHDLIASIKAGQS